VSGWNDACYQGSEQSIGDAFADMTDVQAVYRMRGQSFDRWFPGRPEVSNIETLSPFDKLLVLATGAGAWTVTPKGDTPDSATLSSGWNGLAIWVPGSAGGGGPASRGLAVIHPQVGPVLASLWGRPAGGSNLERLDKYTSVLIMVTDSDGAVWTFDP
jgi:hypothetical protein